MFSNAGHDVHWRSVIVSSDMESVDTVVWFPNDFAVPNTKVRRWFDKWLTERSGRTLIYVGRDFDAAPLYWRKMLPRAEASQRDLYLAELQRATLLASHAPKLDADQQECLWFKIEPGEAHAMDEPGGPWRTGIDIAKLELELRAQLVPRKPFRALLTSDADVLVAQRSIGRAPASHMLIVANGSFLLNLPLVNHEHRKLAGRLISAVGNPGRVVFLESESGGPPVDPPGGASSLWAVFGAWPLNAVLLHFAVLGVIFCFARWPIFGRPQAAAEEPASDFGRHVQAFGELLHRSRDRSYAVAQMPEADRAAMATDGNVRASAGPHD